MIELIDTRPNVRVLESEYQRLLGFPKHYVFEGRARELADQTIQWYAEHGRPWVYAREAETLELTSEGFRVDGTGFSSKRLRDQLAAARVHQIMLVAVSAGRQCEEQARHLWREEKPDEYFFMEMYGSAVAEHLIAATGFRFCAWADEHSMAVLPHYSPGYPEWDIADQKKLLELIAQKKKHDFPENLRVLGTGMLNPKKSLLAVFGVTRHLDRVQRFSDLIPCETCSLPACQYRRAPYKQSVWQIEDVRELQSNDGKDSSAVTGGASSLNPRAQYSFNARALRKWSQQHLEMQTASDGSVEARFRYEGTTCSNLGRPLSYVYHVKLSPSKDGYRIQEASCAPAPGDTGHASQCEYLNDAETLLSAMAHEKPLLGRPLNDVLTWKRPYSPSGCYCDADTRNHKWGLAFEVIHFALVEHEKRNIQPRRTTAILQ